MNCFRLGSNTKTWRSGSSRQRRKSQSFSRFSLPELPLYNNDDEFTIRLRKPKQAVSFGLRTSAGSKAWDTMQSLVGTTRKLGVNIYEYLLVRVTKRAAVPRLADVIKQWTLELNLGAAWG